MKLIFKGKTKDVYENDGGFYTLKFKDDATGKDGVFDPGENAVGLTIEGLGRESLRLSVYFFEMLKAAGIPSHYLGSNIEAAAMDVLPAEKFGDGIEFVCRCKATGGFLKRYGAYAVQGMDLNYLVEVTIKDDERQDPPITKDTLVTLGIMTADEFETCKELTKKMTKLIEEDLKRKGLELYDIKYEFGKNNGAIIVKDEFSAGVMRVYRDGKLVPPMELGGLILG